MRLPFLRLRDVEVCNVAKLSEFAVEVVNCVWLFAFDFGFLDSLIYLCFVFWVWLGSSYSFVIRLIGGYIGSNDTRVV